MAKSLKLGLQLGYWGAQPPEDPSGIAVEAERLGFDSVYTAEAWGSDAFTPLAYIAAHTSKIKLGTAVVQLSGRTPTATAMATLTLDHLSKGRVILGLGVSGPQVVEGWYGQPFSKPLARTREYIDIVRQVLAREAQGLGFERRRHRVVEPIQEAEKCDHGDDVDDLLLREVLPELLEVRLGRGRGHQRPIPGQTEGCPLPLGEERARLELEGRLDLRRIRTGAGRLR